jgi:flagellar basal body P-ring formation protein FlgA
MIRSLVSLLALVVAVPALAAPSLRGDITAARDTLTLGDLVEGAPAALAGRPVFRAPALGRTGTIQAGRILEAARALGLDDVETGGRGQVTVARAARRVGVAEIEVAVRDALAKREGIDPHGVAVVFDGALPSLLVPPDVTEALGAPEIAYDPRGRRVTALVAVGQGEGRASLRVAGHLVETVEVGVVARAVARGDAIAAGDVALERRPREGVPADAQVEPSRLGGSLVGQVAKRALPSGAVLRVGDVQRPEIVGKGEAVLIVFETPGMSLTLRGRASEAGALGESVGVLNLATKKALQATVVGPGRVSVAPGAAAPGPLAAR